MRRLVTAGFFFIALLLIASIVAMIWRAANESDEPQERAAITADFVASCQNQTPECLDMVRDARRWALARGRTTKACAVRRPGPRTAARGAVIWLNAHPKLHPLPVEEGLTRAEDAIWPCKR